MLCCVAAARAVARTDVALYVGLAVALVVFPLIALLALKLYRRKGRGQSMYGLTERGGLPIHFPYLLHCTIKSRHPVI